MKVQRLSLLGASWLNILCQDHSDSVTCVQRKDTLCEEKVWRSWFSEWSHHKEILDNAYCRRHKIVLCPGANRKTDRQWALHLSLSGCLLLLFCFSRKIWCITALMSHSHISCLSRPHCGRASLFYSFSSCEQLWLEPYHYLLCNPIYHN